MRPCPSLLLTRMLLVAGALCLGAGEARGQAPGDREAIDAFRDSLASIEDTVALRTILQREQRATAQGDRELKRLRVGWTLMRIGTATGVTRALVDATDQFYEATVRRPSWPLAWYGLGTAKRELFALGAREVRSPHQTGGTGWDNGALIAFKEGHRRDSTYAPLTEALAQAALATAAPPSDSVIDAAIAQALVADSTNTHLWILQGRALRRRGDHAGALAAFQHTFTLSGPDSPVSELELARELFATGEPAAATLHYYHAARSGDSAWAETIRRDLILVMSPGEAVAWDSLAPAERYDWLYEFWRGREVRSGRPRDTRLVEHYRRWRYAQDHFRRRTAWAVQSDFSMIFRAPDLEFDDRGYAYIRHGAPDLTAGYVGGAGTPPNISWLYYRPAGNVILHFVLGGGVSGWRIVESFGAIAGTDPDAWASRMGLDPSYARVAFALEEDLSKARAQARISGSTADIRSAPASSRTIFLMDRARLRSRSVVQAAMQTDSDPLRFSKSYEPIVQVFGAPGTRAGDGQLLVSVAVPADDLPPPAPVPGGGVGYALRLRVTSADDSGRTTLDVDTVIHTTSPARLAGDEHLVVLRAFDLPAGSDQRVMVIVSDPADSAGGVRVVNGVPLPDVALPEFALTDLIVGRPGSGFDWTSPRGEHVTLNPLNAWPSAGELTVGATLAGLAPGELYTVRFAIGDITTDTTRAPKSAVSFPIIATGSSAQLAQTLGLAGLRPGRYLLTVTVTAGDRAIRRERRITIVRSR